VGINRPQQLETNMAMNPLTKKVGYAEIGDDKKFVKEFRQFRQFDVH